MVKYSESFYGDYAQMKPITSKAAFRKAGVESRYNIDLSMMVYRLIFLLNNHFATRCPYLDNPSQCIVTISQDSPLNSLDTTRPFGDFSV